MKAIVYTKYGSPDVLQLKAVEKPTPKENEVLIRIVATTVTAVDSIYLKGSPFIARIDAGLLKPKKTTLGNELSGEIEAVGKNVKRFKEGDQVFGASDAKLGAHAAYICLPEDGALATKSANISYEEAAATPYGALTALHFLRDAAKVQSGQSVLINGASGSIGTYAVQLAKQYGAKVIGVCSSANVALVKSLGADRVIDYTKEDFTQISQTYDVIFDTVGKSSFSRCKNALKHGGVYLTTVPTLAILLQMLWNSKIGSKKGKMAFAGLRSPSEKREDLIFLAQLVEAGKIKPVIDRRYPLEQIAKAHEYVEKGHKKGNVVITVDSNKERNL